MSRQQRGRQKSRGREIDGMLVLDKPLGLTSNDALQRVKHLFKAAKAGHTGSLDPLATGVLPLCFGEATKMSQFLLDADKRYLTTVKLGVRTDSGDAEGKVIDTRSAAGITPAQVREALLKFTGEIDQVPSMFSAVKHGGQPLYKLARQGIEVERASRRVTIFRNDLLAMREDEVDLDIHCSKGTYVRTIAEDLGEALGCGGHVIALRRLQAGPFGEADMVTLPELEAMFEEGGFAALDARLLPVWSAVRDWPEVTLEEVTAFYLKQGQSVLVPHAPTRGWVRLRHKSEGMEGDFLGVGEVLDDGRIAPRRLLAA